VRGHGVYATARNLNLAYKWSCSLELSARTAWLARVAGTDPEGQSARSRS
jgi:L-fuculose-phosphate aldolase